MAPTIIGTEELTLPATLDECEEFPVEQRRIPLQCHSGRTIGEQWRGVPVDELVFAAEMPEETTHLLVHGAGGYRMCVEIRDAFDCLLAYECNGEPVGGDVATRLVGPAIDSTHSVKGVQRIEGIHLDSDEHPSELETTGESEGEPSA
ncbi:molybdopterin-dependent oxidoreductase [Halovenus sp. WSH3]|uniref:Molybdopterin-dependent oxidoreductase n=1 Tax=Halovenus carboxidivorans TaxID=2692199 RepID=A0A6B0T9H8_9EURY|nr:molybdopterin-dependent oxidoreductase [Halovenus carboxidivorans]